MQRYLTVLFLLGALALPSAHSQTGPVKAPAPATTPAAAPLRDDDPVEGLQVLNGDINDLLGFYEKLSGKTLLRDANLPPTVANLRVVVPQGIPRGQALRLVESVLLLNGYSLVKGDENTVKVLNTAGKNPRSEGVTIYANLSDLPKGDEIVSYYMPFRYMSATEAQQVLQAHTPPHNYGVMVPVTSAQAVIVTDNASVIRQLAKLKDLMDVPPAKVVSRFVTLQRADAERVADIIIKLIDSRKKNQPPGGAPTAASNNAPPPAPGKTGADSGVLNERSLVAGDVDLVADARSNSILVVTRPVNFDYIKDLIGQFDQAVTLTAPVERPLKYVMAGDVLPVLQTLLTESGNQTAPGAQPQGNINNNRQANNGNNTNRQGASNSSSGNGSNTSRTLQENQDTAPDAVMVGKTRLVADKQANSIIVIGPPESVGKVQAILDHLDKRPLQVYLSTVIGQLSIGKDSQFAVDILHKYSGSSHAGAAGSLITGGNVSLVDPKSLTSPAAFASLATGYTLYGAIGSALDYYVTALETTSNFRVTSRPVIYTTNNKGAVISSGQKIAVPGQSLSDVTGGNSTAVTTSINYTDVELKLEVVPLINSDREVTLQIRQTNDSVVGSQVISGNSIPTIGTQYVDTTVTVPNKGIIVLGGLITEDNTLDITGVPILKDIPLLGYLFKGTTKEKKRSELIVMMQPVVVDGDAEMQKASMTEQDASQMGETARIFAEKRVLLPPSTKRPKPAPVTEPAPDEAAPAPPAENKPLPGNATEEAPVPPPPSNL